MQPRDLIQEHPLVLNCHDALQFGFQRRCAEPVGKRFVHANAVEFAHFAGRAVGRRVVVAGRFFRSGMGNLLVALEDFLKDAGSGQVGGNGGFFQPLAIGILKEVCGGIDAAVNDGGVNAVMLARPNRRGQGKTGCQSQCKP